MPAKSRLNDAFRSLREKPIPIFEQETLEAGIDFFKRQLALALPVYLLANTRALTGRRLDQVVPGALALVFVVAILGYFLWTIGTADRWRRGQPMFTAPGQIWGTVKTGFAIWWRAFIVFIRFILVFVAVGFIAGLMGASDRATAIVAFLLWLAVIIPSWGFAVRFWDRTLEVGGAPPPVQDPASTGAKAGRAGIAIVVGAWIVAVAVLGSAFAGRARAVPAFDAGGAVNDARPVDPSPPCRRVAFAEFNVAPSGRYIARIRADSTGQHVTVQPTDGGSELTIVPPARVDYRGVAIGLGDDLVYLARVDSSRVRSLVVVPILGGAVREISGAESKVAALTADWTAFVFASSDVLACKELYR